MREAGSLEVRLQASEEQALLVESERLLESPAARGLGRYALAPQRGTEAR